MNKVLAYLQGYTRYFLFYSRFYLLIPKHIREQIEYRINSMDIQCYEEGQCKLCGCDTTALQMTDKRCDKPCYPILVDKSTWKHLLEGGGYIENFKGGKVWFLNTDKQVFINNKTEDYVLGK